MLREHAINQVKPGVGKTRLALGKETLHVFAQGHCFVHLAHVSDPACILQAIIHALGLVEEKFHLAFETLKMFLSEKHFLLLLDNFEQLLAGTPFLTQLLTVCPRLKVIVTSRTTLHIQGEYEFVVAPLPVPDLHNCVSLEEMEHIAAVALFVGRVEAFKPGFALTESNASLINKICQRLEGMPLSLELAAARIKVLPLHTLLARLESRLECLSRYTPTAPFHQRSLQEAIR